MNDPVQHAAGRILLVTVPLAIGEVIAYRAASGLPVFELQRCLAACVLLGLTWRISRKVWILAAYALALELGAILAFGISGYLAVTDPQIRVKAIGGMLFCILLSIHGLWSLAQFKYAWKLVKSDQTAT